MPPILTIAIPTFDRNAMVARHVAALLPQLDDRCRLIIIDNCSPTPVSESLQGILARHPAAPVQVLRNSVNIGAAANILRCVEHCETAWLWTLGDDDRPLEDAVATALAEISRADGFLLINFSSMGHAVNPDRETDGLEGFIAGIPNFANLTLISNNLVRADRLKTLLRHGYYRTYGLFVHFAMWLLALIDAGGRCRFSPRQLVEWGPASDWSRVLAGAGVGILLDLPLPKSCRRRLSAMLVDVSGKYSSLAAVLLDQVGTRIDAATARHLFRQAWFRLYRHHRPVRHFLIRMTGATLLMMPGPTKALYRWYRRMRGNPLAATAHDELHRM